MIGSRARLAVTVGFILLIVICSFVLVGNLIPPGSVGGMTGRAISLVRIVQSDMVNCTFPLNAGMNYFSAYCLGTQDDFNSMFGSLVGVESVFSFEPSDAQGDLWKTYNPSLPSWVVQDLSVYSRKKGYVVMMGVPGVFMHEGIDKDSDTIDMVPGWNLIGYPVDTAHPVNVTFSSIPGMYTAVVTFNTTDQDYVYYVVGDPNSTLVETPAFYGYWVNMTQTATIMFTR